MKTKDDTDGVFTARLEDIPDIIEMILEFDRTGPKVSEFRMNPDHARKTLETILSPHQQLPSACFFTDNAVMAGQIVPCAYNFSVRMAEEVVLRSNGRDGDKVLLAFERWGANNGATHVKFQTNFGIGREKARGRRLVQMGYKATCVGWLTQLV